jgi:hypothetical protein
MELQHILALHFRFCHNTPLMWIRLFFRTGRPALPHFIEKTRHAIILSSIYMPSKETQVMVGLANLQHQAAHALHSNAVEYDYKIWAKKEFTTTSPFEARRSEPSIMEKFRVLQP